MNTLLNLAAAAVLAGTPLLLGTLGEILTEKSGNINLGVEGMMFMGAIAGLSVPYFYEQLALEAGVSPSGTAGALMALAASFAAGALGALIYGFLTITLHADQNVTGLTLTIFGTGLGNFFGEYLGYQAGGYAALGEELKSAFHNLSIPGLSQIPVLGKLLFQYNWMVYFAVILSLAMNHFLRRTRLGLNLRAVGEDPAAADAAGIDTTRYQYTAVIIGGGICGIGGMYMSMVTTSGVWVHNCVSGYGWLSVALVIFSVWSPARALLAAVIFGGLTVLRLYLPIPGMPIQIYEMLPYAVTILVLIVTSIRQRRENMQPKSCGVNYFREER